MARRRAAASGGLAHPAPALRPVAPLPAGGASSVCSAPSARLFRVECGAASPCVADPTPSAVLHLVSHSVEGRPPTCATHAADVPVACGDTIELRLAAPPCPARGARSPQSAPFVDSRGVLVVHAESALLVVTATDSCGTTGSASFDPAVDPPEPCEQPLPDGSCCPAIAAPAVRNCPGGICSGFTAALHDPGGAGADAAPTARGRARER